MPKRDQYTQIVTLTIPQAAYFAGIVDGEGSLHMSKCSNAKQNIHKIPHYQAALQISSTDQVLIEWLYNLMGGCKGEYTPRQTPKNSRKKVYRWSCTGNRLKHMCEQILPYLVIKKREAELIILFRESVNQFAYFAREKGMNRSLPQEVIDYRESLFVELHSIHNRNYCNYH